MLRRVLIQEVSASLAIAVIWLAVALDALWGPDFVSTTATGNMTRIPSAIVVAIFAYLATRVIARHAFTSTDARADDPSARGHRSDPVGSST